MFVPKYGLGGCYLYIFVFFTQSQHQFQSNIPVLDLITYVLYYFYLPGTTGCSDQATIHYQQSEWMDSY